jgi:Protein kinase domain/PEGA domain
VVYRAEDPTIGRTVALKTTRVDVEGLESEDLLRRFRQEARAAGVLNHPNIVTIYDAGEQDGLFYIAMEFVDGRTLQSLLLEHNILPPEQLVDIGRQICAGLDLASSHGVVHRDIKPANIMITPDGLVKIMDFGIAKSGAGMTTAGQVLGTPSYMSPEQVKGQPLDGRSDLFSLGVILYEAATGVKPFSGEGITAIIYKIVHEEPLPVRRVAGGVHPGLSRVITRALAKSTAERYQRGSELARDLLNYKMLGAEESTVMSMPAGGPPAMSGIATGAASALASPGASAALDETAPQVSGAPVTAAPRKSGSALLVALLVGVLTLLVAVAGLGWVGYTRIKRQRQRAAEAIAAQQAAPSPPATINPLPAPATTTTPETTPATTPETSAATPDQTVATTSLTTTPAEPVAAKPDTTKPEKSALTASTQPTPTRKASSKPVVKPSSGETAKSLPPPKPVVSTTGDLHVISSPDGVRVLVDGQSDSGCTAPCTVGKLSPGSHQVTMIKAGYGAATRTVEIAAGKTAELSAALEPTPATLSVASMPPGAAILVDGKETGKVTPAQFPVDAGVHSVLLRKPSFEPAETTLNMHSGESYSFAPSLRPNKDNPLSAIKHIFGGGDKGSGVLDVRTNPKGAEVWIDGVLLPRKTPTRTPMQPGTYQLSIRKDGFKTMEKTVVVKKSEPLQVQETLEKQ